MWKIAGIPCTFAVDFKLNDEFVIPDEGTVSYAVRDVSGDSIVGQTDITITGSTFIMSVSEIANVLTAGNLYEPRFIHVDYKFAGRPATIDFSYNISAFVPLTKQPSDARALLGVDFRELPDQDIDLMAAYFSLVETYGVGFSESVASSGSATTAANNAVLIKAILDIFPSMQSRILLRERSDTSEYQRAKTNFALLKTELEQRLSDSLALIPLIADQITTSSLAILVLSSPTDPVTNA